MTSNPACFLLFKICTNADEFSEKLNEMETVDWSIAVFGPYQVVAYCQETERKKLINNVEMLRTLEGVSELDARIVKPIPEDKRSFDIIFSKKEKSVLLINVDYRIEKERIVTLQLRKLNQIIMARAMWGPSDIIAIAEADDHESMRDLICDHVKILPGVKTNTTLYCYP